MDIFNFFTPKARTFYMLESATIRQALEKFDYHKFTVVPLIDDKGKYISTVSEGDILRYIKNEAEFDISVAQSVRLKNIEKYRPYQAIDLRVSMDEVLKLSLDQNFIPLTDDRGLYIGILKRKDIIAYLYKNKL